MRLQERLLQRFANDHPDEAALLLAERTADEVVAVMTLLPDDTAVGLLARAGTAVGAGALARLDVERSGALVARLPLERAAALLRHLEPEARERLLATVPGAERLQALIAYPPGTAGALMDPSVLALPAALDLDAARQRLGELCVHVALELYVVDQEHRLVGVADLREVLDPSRRGALSALARDLEPLGERTDLASLTAHPGWLHHDSLPVVDGRGTYLGAVRGERLRQVVQEEVSRRSRRGADATLALGELFWLGLTGLLSSLAPSPKEAE